MRWPRYSHAPRMNGRKIALVARPQFWGDGRQGTNVGLLPDGRQAARSVANGYFLHPKRNRKGVLKRNTLLLSVCLDSGYTLSDFLGRRIRAAEVQTYADGQRMETAGRAAGAGERS